VTESSEPTDAASYADGAVELVAAWLDRAQELESPRERRTMERLAAVTGDPDAVTFVMRFVDRVMRPDSATVAAQQLEALVVGEPLPGFLGPADRVLLRSGRHLATRLPGIVIGSARRRMRSIVGHLVAPADEQGLAAHLAKRRGQGYLLNVNLLGEAVLGEREASRRLDALLRLIDEPQVDYVSVKVSSIASQLNHWAYDDACHRVSERLRTLLDRAVVTRPPTFVNLDMEEHHDIDLTLDVFTSVLDEDAYRAVSAGIVLQAYVPETCGTLQRLATWANARHDAGGGEIKIRLVKGANLAMERVDAAMHGWEQTPYATKIETDAGYKRCLDWLLHPERMAGVRLGLASHNLFDVAWTHLLAAGRGVTDRVQFEMLQGMAPAQGAAVRESTDSSGSAMLLYTPAVRSEDFDVAIGYLFRRLEENASDDNFLRHLFELAPGSPEFEEQERIFRTALARRDEVSDAPRRTQDRAAEPTAAYTVGAPFVNEPETDPSSEVNRDWIRRVASAKAGGSQAPIETTVEAVDAVLAASRSAAPQWRAMPAAERQRLLHRAATELAARRGDLIATMMQEACKTFGEADVEVAEAIDFARWYGDRAVDLVAERRAEFDPFGVVAVIPPWNFPVAIPAGGVFAALAAGNTVVLKPAPETPRCAEIVVEACRAAGIPADAAAFLRVPDDDVGRHLVTSADAVILTGSAETSDLFRSWKPDMRLFAETSGKNAMVITPSADVDLAVADLVRSAFGHSGQKCSAASLAILVDDLYESERFRRQLIDAVESIEVGSTTDLPTTMGPLISEPNERLRRALTDLTPGERWLVGPRSLDDNGRLWSPGVRDGVMPDSWFFRTECFGPVLGLVPARDLDEAIEIQNSSSFGLTGGIHSLDPGEVGRWLDRVEVGNAYVNRHITGAIVQRQPFGGWKLSSVGPGAKAGGPNYVAQFGVWRPAETETDVEPGVDVDDYEHVWAEHFSVGHDPTGLFCEANVFRYRPLDRIALRVEATAEADVDVVAVERVRRAARLCGVEVIESDARHESVEAFAGRLPELGVDRVRVAGGRVDRAVRRVANEHGIHLADGPVTGSGRIELQHYVREQAVSRTLHRFGNLVMSSAADASPTVRE
jgi:RHH-type proline utilization regulon transcriptional repressor/proline dehydrogenase/delta 1-pyrroline-5-carboxylate dehydrogenase